MTTPGGLTIELVADPIEQLDDLLRLRQRWADEQDRQPLPNEPFEADFEGWLRSEQLHRRFWIARVEGAPVGMVNLLIFNRMPTVGSPSGGWGYLCNMFVDEEHRNCGIGAVLASELLGYADAFGLERVVLSPSERSRPFYASLGFEAAEKLLLRPRPLSSESQPSTEG